MPYISNDLVCKIQWKHKEESSNKASQGSSSSGFLKASGSGFLSSCTAISCKILVHIVDMVYGGGELTDKYGIQEM